MKTALTIAGSDSSGGAGIQADIKTMTMNRVYAMSAVTALTAQNTTGVTGILEASPEFLKQELDAVFTDIFPDAVKTGMVSSSALIHTIAESLRHYNARNIVVDPVMVSTSGARLIAEDAVGTLEAELLPLALVVTPNIPEAEILSGVKITGQDTMTEAAKVINARYGCAVLVKGGHNVNDANDLLCTGQDGLKWFYGKHIDNPNTHGTGCTLSSAIAANLAKGYALDEAVRRAKEYISGALGAMLNLGKGSGPMNHMFSLPDNSGLYERLMSSVSDIWPQYYAHPFVKGIETGTLDVQKFRHYITQDYLYLNEYAKVFSLGAAKAHDPELMALFASYVQAITKVEMNIHHGYLGRFGVSQEEIDATPRTHENLAYTSYMIRVAYEEGEAEIAAAVLSCALSYEDIALNIVKNNPDAVNHEVYGNWVKCYSGDEYREGNRGMMKILETLTVNYTQKQISHLAEIFRVCSRHELEFWNMAWRGNV